MNESDEKRWRRRSDARPAELVQAAFELFAEQGYSTTRLEDVAARAGVSKATIYRYFENKEALFAAVVNENVVPRFTEAEVLLNAFEGSSEDLLRTFVKVVRGGLNGPFPPMIKLVLTESRNFPELADLWAELVVKRIFALVGRIITRGIERGEFQNVDVQSITPLVGAPFFLLAMVKQTFAPHRLTLDEDGVTSAHLDLLLHGLRRNLTEKT